MCKRQEGTTWRLRTVRSLASFLFFDTMSCLFKSKREKVWRGILWWTLRPHCCRGFGPVKPAISVPTPPKPLDLAPSAVGLAPSARQQARNLYIKNFKSLKGLIGSDLNEAVPNHPANLNNSQTSGDATGFSCIAFSFVLFFTLLPFSLRKIKIRQLSLFSWCGSIINCVNIFHTSLSSPATQELWYDVSL